MNIGVKAPSTVRLASLNAFNFADDINDPDKDGGGTPKLPFNVEALATVIRDSKADIIALQEVEHIELLRKMCEDYDLSERFPEIVLIEGNDGRGMDVALMSRYPIESFETHRDHVLGYAKQDKKEEKPLFFSRDLLGADISLPNGESLRVFTNHFIMPGKKFDEKRLMEAEAAKEIVERAAREDPVDYQVMMGDFNAERGSGVMETFTEEDGFYELSKDYPPSWIGRWNSKFEPTSLDHILADKALVEQFVSGGTFNHTLSSRASDHRLIWADIALPTLPRKNIVSSCGPIHPR